MIWIVSVIKGDYVKITTMKEGFFYEGDVVDVSDTHVSIIDKKHKNVDIHVEDIRRIERD